jgi:hypothetical protein
LFILCRISSVLTQQDLPSRDEVDEKVPLGPCGIVENSRSPLNRRTFLILDGFAPLTEWS